MSRIVVFLLALAVTTSSHGAESTLEKVVILQRHGVRSPTMQLATLAPFARDPWAEWSVKPGDLTEHGEAAVRLMGEGLWQHYTALGLLPKSGCPAKDAVFVWADNADLRTKQSGAAMAASLAPGCGAVAQAGAEGSRDPLFHPAEKFCPVDAALAEQQAQANLDRVLTANRAAYDSAREALSKVLYPGLSGAECNESSAKKCVLFADHNEIRKAGRLSGSLRDGVTLSGVMMLEYAQGMNAGWGRIDNADKLAAVMPLRYLGDLVGRVPAITSHTASLIARQVRDALEPVAAFEHRAPVPTDAKLVLLAGHDTNISALAGLMGIDWTLPNQPDVTAPDTALAFEVWRNADGTQAIKLVVFYQTPDQLRSLTRFSAGQPVPRAEVALPGCGTGVCGLKTVTTLLDTGTAPECIRPAP